MNEPAKINVAANRKAHKYSLDEQAKRVAWGLAQPLFALSPRPLWGWRRFILRFFGAKVGLGAHIYPSVKITIPWNLVLGDHSAIGDRAVLYCLGIVMIGARTTVSQGAHLCAGTHDWRSPAMPLLKMPISVGQDVWICAEAFIGPGVTIGDNSIVGARAVVMKDVPSDVIMAGNPARKIGRKDK